MLCVPHMCKKYSGVDCCKKALTQTHFIYMHTVVLFTHVRQSINQSINQMISQQSVILDLKAIPQYIKLMLCDLLID